MRKKYRNLAILGLSAVVAGAITIPALAGGESDKSSSGVYWFADPATSVGHSNLWRGDDGVRMTFKTSGLAPEEALTIWWVVFNEPEDCSPPGCGEDDIFLGGDPNAGLDLNAIAAADIVAGYATGELASNGGNANLKASLAEGEIGPEVIFGAAPLLKDAAAAEIHLVARSHGPAIPGMEDEQTGSFAGGCTVFLNPPSIPDEAGECADIQFAVHLP